MFASGKRTTTTDALQTQWEYCPLAAHKETVTCPSVDTLGNTREVFVDRLCDGFPDCRLGEDEIGGNGATWTCNEAQARIESENGIAWAC